MTMHLFSDLEIPKGEFFLRRTEGWNWFGEERWWEIFAVIHGFHGGGGFVITEQWRWNGSSQHFDVTTET